MTNRQDNVHACAKVPTDRGASLPDAMPWRDNFRGQVRTGLVPLQRQYVFRFAWNRQPITELVCAAFGKCDGLKHGGLK
jgi:hypothetical protein